ncbi:MULTISPECIES: hypothetical protein [Methanobacterium]|uniref:hypothetical protein n=1 Tax=Methanobacterium TaxID=2160 RepID=UPI0015B45CBE|nr:MULTISPECIES: hypothetical protein [Methanobacterium]
MAPPSLAVLPMKLLSSTVKIPLLIIAPPSLSYISSLFSSCSVADLYPFVRVKSLITTFLPF